MAIVEGPLRPPSLPFLVLVLSDEEVGDGVAVAVGGEEEEEDGEEEVDVVVG